jgi:hypothetical protein
VCVCVCVWTCIRSSAGDGTDKFGFVFLLLKIFKNYIKRRDFSWTGISVIAFDVFLSSASVISRLCVDWDTNGFVWRRGHKNPEIWWNFSQAAVDGIFVFFFVCVLLHAGRVTFISHHIAISFEWIIKTFRITYIERWSGWKKKTGYIAAF